MDFSWIADVKDLVVDGIVFLSEQSPFLGGAVVLVLFLALAARIADLDEIIKAWKTRKIIVKKETEEDED